VEDETRVVWNCLRGMAPSRVLAGRLQAWQLLADWQRLTVAVACLCRCQPWTIILTGSSVVGGAWQLSGQRIWVTALVAVPVAAW